MPRVIQSGACAGSPFSHGGAEGPPAVAEQRNIPRQRTMAAKGFSRATAPSYSLAARPGQSRARVGGADGSRLAKGRISRRRGEPTGGEVLALLVDQHAGDRASVAGERELVTRVLREVAHRGERKQLARPPARPGDEQSASTPGLLHAHDEVERAGSHDH